MLITFQITFSFQGRLNACIDGFKLEGGCWGGGRKGQLVREEEETKSKWEKLPSSLEKITLECLPPKQRASVYEKIIVKLTQYPQEKWYQWYAHLYEPCMWIWLLWSEGGSWLELFLSQATDLWFCDYMLPFLQLPPLEGFP